MLDEILKLKYNRVLSLDCKQCLQGQRGKSQRELGLFVRNSKYGMSRNVYKVVLQCVRSFPEWSSRLEWKASSVFLA